jgi:hypothetical protein
MRVPIFFTWPDNLSAAIATASAIPRNESAMIASDMAIVGPTHSGVALVWTTASAIMW